jgi:hypothetical protein
MPQQRTTAKNRRFEPQMTFEFNSMHMPAGSLRVVSTDGGPWHALRAGVADCSRQQQPAAGACSFVAPSRCRCGAAAAVGRGAAHAARRPHERCSNGRGLPSSGVRRAAPCAASASCHNSYNGQMCHAGTIIRRSATPQSAMSSPAALHVQAYMCRHQNMSQEGVLYGLQVCCWPQFSTGCRSLGRVLCTLTQLTRAAYPG